MLVRYWQPWRELETLRRQFDQVFDDLTHISDDRTWTPAIELKDAGETLVVRAQIPGIDAKDLDIQVMREAISLAGEYRAETKTEAEGLFRSEFRYGKFQRLIPLPVPVENTQVKAEYKDGILNLTLPKAAEARHQVVKINVAELQPPAETPQIGKTEEPAIPTQTPQ